MKKKVDIIESTRVALTYCDEWEQTRSVLNGLWRTVWERCTMKMMDTVRGAVLIGVLKERERVRFNAKYDEKRNVYTISADVLNMTRKGN